MQKLLRDIVGKNVSGRVAWWTAYGFASYFNAKIAGYKAEYYRCGNIYGNYVCERLPQHNGSHIEFSYHSTLANYDWV